MRMRNRAAAFFEDILRILLTYKYLECAWTIEKQNVVFRGEH